MAVATSTAIALALAAASAGVGYYNTQSTLKKQDQQAALGIQNQSRIQQKADAKVQAEVDDLAKSRSEEHRREALDSYMQTLVANKSKLQQGLTPNFGSQTFQADSAKAAGGVQQYAADEAGLMARMDAPNDQRREEAYGYGKLGTDISLIGRESAGQRFLDELRLRAIRRNPGLDALSAFLGGAASSGIGSGGGSATGMGVPAQGTGPDSFGGYGYGSTWGTGNGLKAAGY